MADQFNTKNLDIPAGIKKWNWGAFLLNWIWGIGNNTYIALLCFVPVANIIMPFVLGAKGNEWAWKNKRWESVEDFHRIQREWAKWGIVIFASLTIFFVVAFGTFFWGFDRWIKNSDFYRSSLTAIGENQELRNYMGSPVKVGWFVSGNIESDSAKGKADISYSLNGPRGSGKAYVEATKRYGEWRLDRVLVVLDKDKTKLDLLPGSLDKSERRDNGRKEI